MARLTTRYALDDEDEILSALLPELAAPQASEPEAPELQALAAPRAAVTPDTAPAEVVIKTPPVGDQPAAVETPATAKKVAEQSDDLGVNNDALQQLWRDKELEYLREAGKPASGTFGQFVQDNSIGILGTLLDLGLNKGRNIPQIMTSSAAHQQRAIRGREQDRAQYADLALQARQQREAAARAARGDSTEARLRQQYDLDNNPDNPYAQQLREKLIQAGVPREQVEGLAYKALKDMMPHYQRWMQHGMADIAASDAANRAGAVATRQNEVQTEYHPTEVLQKGEVAAETARQGVIGRVAGETGTLPQALQNEAERLRNQSEATDAGKIAIGAKRRIPGTQVTDLDVYARNAADDTTYKKMQDMAEGLKTMQAGIDRMIELRAKYGMELIGDVKAQYDLAQVAVNTGLTKLGSTGTLTDGERKYYESMLPKMAPQLWDIVRLIPGQPDPMLEMLKGARTQIGATGQAKSQIYGFGMGADMPAPPTAASPTAAQPPTAARPRAVLNRDGSYTIDGERYTAEEVQTLKQRGVIQ